MAWCSIRTMKIRLLDGLLYVTASILSGDQTLTLENVLLDTGSAGSIFKADILSAIGLEYGPDDNVHHVRGVGGTEFVFTNRLDRLAVGTLQADNFEIEVGAMDYGFDIAGIIGADFLIQVGAVIDLTNLVIDRTVEP